MRMQAAGTPAGRHSTDHTVENSANQEAFSAPRRGGLSGADDMADAGHSATVGAPFAEFLCEPSSLGVQVAELGSYQLPAAGGVRLSRFGLGDLSVQIVELLLRGAHHGQQE